MNKYFNKIAVAITVTDKNGNIIEMNEKAKKVFAKYGNVIGKNLNDCHNEKSKKIIKEMFEKKFINAYTIEKKGVKKLIYQLPYYDDNNEFSGYIEMSFEIPYNMPHFKRD